MSGVGGSAIPHVAFTRCAALIRVPQVGNIRLAGARLPLTLIGHSCDARDKWKKRDDHAALVFDDVGLYPYTSAKGRADGKIFVDVSSEFGADNLMVRSAAQRRVSNHEAA